MSVDGYEAHGGCIEGLKVGHSRALCVDAAGRGCRARGAEELKIQRVRQAGLNSLKSVNLVVLLHEVVTA